MSVSNETSPSSWIDPDDAPEWGDDVFARAQIAEGGKIIRPASGTLTQRGRPRSEEPKQQVTLRLDRAVVARFRDGGPGWQSRMNAALRKAAGL